MRTPFRRVIGFAVLGILTAVGCDPAPVRPVEDSFVAEKKAREAFAKIADPWSVEKAAILSYDAARSVVVLTNAAPHPIRFDPRARVVEMRLPSGRWATESLDSCGTDRKSVYLPPGATFDLATVVDRITHKDRDTDRELYDFSQANGGVKELPARLRIPVAAPDSADTLVLEIMRP